jgi:hypothetical protein
MNLCALFLSQEGDEMLAPTATTGYSALKAGQIAPVFWRRYWKFLRLLDTAADVRIATAIGHAQRAAQSTPRQAVLLTATQVPGRENDLKQVIEHISGATRHNVSVAIVEMSPIGKFDNINLAIAGRDLSSYDWILVVDDDIDLPDGFLDLLLYFAHKYELKLAQPAHRFLSFASFKVTERRWASLARSTGFVEIGPVSLIHSDTFRDLVPFPSLRWSWGLDVLWAQRAKDHDWTIGVIDATPIRHLRPVGGSYEASAAQAEAEAFLTLQSVTITSNEMFGLDRKLA